MLSFSLKFAAHFCFEATAGYIWTNNINHMNLIKKLLLFSFCTCIYLTANAQVEVARLQSKDFSATGFGAFLNFSFPVTQDDAVIAEGAFYYFKHTKCLVDFCLAL